MVDPDFGLRLQRSGCKRRPAQLSGQLALRYGHPRSGWVPLPALGVRKAQDCESPLGWVVGQFESLG